MIFIDLVEQFFPDGDRLLEAMQAIERLSFALFQLGIVIFFKAATYDRERLVVSAELICRDNCIDIENDVFVAVIDRFFGDFERLVVVFARKIYGCDGREV